jgi:hypothetical protein
MKTMDIHPSTEELSAYVDRDLDAEAEGRARTHLQACAACRRVVDDLGALRQKLAALGEVEPPHDLFAPIAKACAAEQRASFWERLRRAWMIPAGALAGATAAFLAVWFWAQPARKGPEPAARPDRALQAVARAESVYRRAIAVLEKAMAAERPSLGAKAVAGLRNGLADVDRAIERCRALLRESPGSIDAHQAVLAAYQHKVDLLNEIVFRDGM